MLRWIAVILVVLLAACGGAGGPSAPTDLPQTDSEPTPTFESGDEPQTGAASVAVQFSGAIEGTFTQALLTTEVGKDYEFLFEKAENDDPVQLRLILAADIEPGTHAIVAAADFQLPAGATVAARFDLGFPARGLSGELVLESIGENNFTGSINLTAQDGDETVMVAGRFENLNVVVIG